MDIETINTLLDLLNPLGSALDKATMDLPEENYPADYSRDDEFDVVLTRGMERDITQAILILEDRRRQATKANIMAGFDSAIDAIKSAQ